MKKKRISVIILLIFFVVVFFFGWIQFAVPVGKYGVMMSKTGGINSDPIIPGEFRWQWEKLLPTNVTLFTFDPTPITKKISVTGELPSGTLYGSLLEGHPDFSWQIDVSVNARVSPTKLPVLVDRYAVRTQDELQSWVTDKLEEATNAVIRSTVFAVMNDPGKYGKLANDTSYVTEVVSEQLSQYGKQELDIVSVTPTAVKLPDFALYKQGADVYTAYQKTVEDLLAKTAASEASNSVAEYLQMERFTKWGELLTKYPVLIEFLAVARDDAGETLKALKNIH